MSDQDGMSDQEKHEELSKIGWFSLNDSRVFKSLSFSAKWAYLWKCRKTQLISMVLFLLVAIPAGLGIKDTIKSLLKADPAVEAGAVIKQSLTSPDSFQYVSGKTIWSGTSQNGDPAYVVLVSYDAQNGFGALLRGCAEVAFHETKDGKISWSKDYGMQDTDRALCENTAENADSLLKDLGKDFADLNFDITKRAAQSTPVAPTPAPTPPAPAANAAPASTPAPTPAQTSNDPLSIYDRCVAAAYNAGTVPACGAPPSTANTAPASTPAPASAPAANAAPPNAPVPAPAPTANAASPSAPVPAQSNSTPAPPLTAEKRAIYNQIAQIIPQMFAHLGVLSAMSDGGYLTNRQPIDDRVRSFSTGLLSSTDTSGARQNFVSSKDRAALMIAQTKQKLPAPSFDDWIAAQFKFEAASYDKLSSQRSELIKEYNSNSNDPTSIYNSCVSAAYHSGTVPACDPPPGR